LQANQDRETIPSVATGERWLLRDFLWLLLGTVAAYLLVVPLIEVSDGVFRAQALVVVGIALLLMPLLPRTGAVMPRRPSDPAPDPTILGPLRIQLLNFVGLAAVFWFALHFGDNWWLGFLLLGWAVLFSVVKLGARDVVWVCIAFAAITLLIPPYLDLLLVSVLTAAAVFVVLLLLVRLSSWPYRVAVWLSATLSAGVAAYFIALRLGGEPLIIPACLVAAGTVWLLASRRVHANLFANLTAPTPSRAIRYAASAWLAVPVGAVVAAVSIGLLVWAGWVNYRIQETGLTISDESHVLGPPYPSTSGGPTELAERFEPFFVFSQHEKWRPTSAELYLQTATLLVGRSVKPGSTVVDARASDAEACRGPRTTPCTLTINCPTGDPSCSDDAKDRKLVVYARVISDPLGREGFVPERAPTPLRGLQTLIQYWAFYRYDDWRAWPFDGWRQWHEGDWEWTAVGLGQEGPLFAAFSAHCGGSWRAWNKLGGLAGSRNENGVLLPEKELNRGHHPLAFVADGTHAMYPDPRVRAPNWKSCTKSIPASVTIATWGPTYAAEIREQMTFKGELRDDTIVGPAVVDVTEHLPPYFRFNGYWGRANHMRTFWRGGGCPPESPDAKCGPGPETPPLKQSWRAPIATIFCDDDWIPHGHCPGRL
jgi:hypothetical protein